MSSELVLMDAERDNSSAAEYCVKRKVLDEIHLDELAQKKTRSAPSSLGEQVKDSLR